MSSVVDVSGNTRTEFISTNRPAIDIYYEHPRWFERVFAALDQRGIGYRKHLMTHQVFDPGQPYAGAPVVFNRMSPSAYHRGQGHALLYTQAWLGHLERSGVRVINGARAFAHELSKSLQLSVLTSLGLRGPRTRVIHTAEDAPAAAEGLRFPVVVKPNVGGSGVGIVRFDRPADLADAARSGALDLGFDHVGLVQEFIPARGGHIIRVECVGGRYLYAIRVHLSGQTFDLCPADICQTGAGVSLDTGSPALEPAANIAAPKAGLRVDAYEPPAAVVRDVERILKAMDIDVGGIEYIVDDRDGQLYYYDVNALSNFVADATTVLGFDPFERLVDYLAAEVSHA
jgi:glutathione synthase/RimK-type ligase-like ATP-grasp enzyme